MVAMRTGQSGLVLGCRSKGKQFKRFEGQTLSGSRDGLWQSGGLSKGFNAFQLYPESDNFTAKSPTKDGLLAVKVNKTR